MKIALLGNVNSVHTRRWTQGLQERGHEVHLVSASRPDGTFPYHLTHVLPFRPKAGYYLNALHLRKLLNRLKPDITHVHYASGYGTLMRLCGYRPYILSVWGSDVFEYPDRSPQCFKLLRMNLKSAGTICATSNVMARRTKTLCPDLETIHVTPFGIDTDVFRPMTERKAPSCITVGTVKSLSRGYAVDILLRAFAKVHEQLVGVDPQTSAKLRLRITGGGPEEKPLKLLARKLGIEHISLFRGAIRHSSVADELNRLDVYLAVSRCEESFGVAVLEASACGLPVIVSDRGGLPEVVADGQTGVIVPSEDVERTAAALLEYVVNPHRRHEMGAAGRRFVQERYDWCVSLDIMEEVYRKFSEKHR